MLSTLRPLHVINTVPPDRGKLVTLMARISKRQSLLIAGDGRRSVYDQKLQRYAEDNRTAFIRNGKSEAIIITNNRTVRSRYSTTEANC